MTLKKEIKHQIWHSSLYSHGAVCSFEMSEIETRYAQKNAKDVNSQDESPNEDFNTISESTADLNGMKRAQIIAELISVGIKADEFESCKDIELEHLLRGVKWLQRTVGGPSSLGPNAKIFSDVDKQVLKSLIISNGRISSLTLSRQLDIPLTTVQRRRKRLESEFVEMNYVMKLDKIGWRKANLMISTDKGRAKIIGKELMSSSSITSISRTIGEHTIDLMGEVVFKDNSELLNIIEWIKSTEGVKEVIWTEAVELLGKNSDKTLEIVEKQP